MASHTEMGGSSTCQFGIWNDMFHKQISFKIMIPLKALGLIKEIQGLSSNFKLNLCSLTKLTHHEFVPPKKLKIKTTTRQV